jgi:hypothetical protein
MTQLPVSSTQAQTVNAYWQQLTLTLTKPLPLLTGARIACGAHLLAPWRQQGNLVDCLTLSDSPLNPTQPLHLVQQGHALSHLNTDDRLLLTGVDLGIADALFACQQLHHHAHHTLVLLQADAFPCVIKPARFMVDALANLIAACPLLEDWGFANRLVSQQELPGCFQGNITSLLPQLAYITQHWHF